MQAVGNISVDLLVAMSESVPNLRYAKDEAGKSLVLIRTETGASALQEAESDGALVMERDVPLSDVCTSQKGILWRRFYSPSRIRLAALWARG